MFLIVGLGNPEEDYSKTRHNMGFNVINKLAEKYNIEVNKSKFKGLAGSGIIENEKVILLKPQTFMNLSGTAVKEVVNYFKIPLEDVIVVYDDMALAPGNIRLRLEGSSGGHKGMQNIIELCGSQQIKRIRVGIGEPGEWDTVDYVLSKPLQDERPLIEEAINNAVEALKEVIKSDFDRAMNRFN